MPEHRRGTPAQFRLLESFLWHDFDTGPSAWADWLKHRKIDVVAIHPSFETAKLLHTALRVMQADNTNDSSIAEIRKAINDLNQLIDIFAIRPRLINSQSIHLASCNVDYPIGQLLVEAIEAMQTGSWLRFKLCKEPTCRASFFDESKASRKIWCDMNTCGSQNKMRRYRAK